MIAASLFLAMYSLMLYTQLVHDGSLAFESSRWKRTVQPTPGESCALPVGEQEILRLSRTFRLVARESATATGILLISSVLEMIGLAVGVTRVSSALQLPAFYVPFMLSCWFLAVAIARAAARWEMVKAKLMVLLFVIAVSLLTPALIFKDLVSAPCQSNSTAQLSAAELHAGGAESQLTLLQQNLADERANHAAALSIVEAHAARIRQLEEANAKLEEQTRAAADAQVRTASGNQPPYAAQSTVESVCRRKFQSTQADRSYAPRPSLFASAAFDLLLPCVFPDLKGVLSD